MTLSPLPPAPVSRRFLGLPLVARRGGVGALAGLLLRGRQDDVLQFRQLPNGHFNDGRLIPAELAAQGKEKFLPFGREASRSPLRFEREFTGRLGHGLIVQQGSTFYLS